MRWGVMLIALMVLVVFACKAYFWFVEDVSRRETLVVTGRSGTADDIGGAASGAAAAANVPVIVPTVVPATASPVFTVDLGNIDDPDQRRSVCGYLAAERERLGHEFAQPLPPPVIDRIATETDQLRAQAGRYDCAPVQQQGAGTDAPNPSSSRGMSTDRTTMLSAPGEVETE